MGATNITAAQWIFPVSVLTQSTPSRTASSISLEKELYDRARGIEFLFRLGVSLGLPSSAMYTAATWFHRFYMRFSMEDYHRQDVAAACIFLATKTEECGRKLRDISKVYCSKISKIKLEDIAENSKEVEESQTAILLTEEVLLEALCFDFVVANPHSELVDLIEAREERSEVEEYAWTIASDSYRTPLCVLYTARIIAAACYVLAQQFAEGPSSLSLAARIASPAPSASLPTPPSHKPAYPESARFAVNFFKFNEVELAAVAEALTTLIDFYGAHDIQGGMEYLASVSAIPPPDNTTTRQKLYHPLSHVALEKQRTVPSDTMTSGNTEDQQQASPPRQSHSPAKASSHGWKPVNGELPTRPTPSERLDLS